MPGGRCQRAWCQREPICIISIIHTNNIHYLIWLQNQEQRGQSKGGGGWGVCKHWQGVNCSMDLPALLDINSLLPLSKRPHFPPPLVSFCLSPPHCLSLRNRLLSLPLYSVNCKEAAEFTHSTPRGTIGQVSLHWGSGETL